jgi:tetratricopeptide (TPR) repeat protein
LFIRGSSFLELPPITSVPSLKTVELRDFSDAFGLEKMRSGNPAVYLLKEEFESFFTSPQRIDVCHWIAKYFYQLEQFTEAGNWYETAGKLILAEPSTPTALKALSALAEYEKALDCYQRNSEGGEELEKCTTLVKELERACAPA